MCLTLSNRFEKVEDAIKYGKSKYTIAKDNITVYKKLWKLGKDYVSPHRCFPYEKGTHYYQDGNWCTFNTMYTTCGIQLEINEGLHAYLNPIFVTLGNDMVVVKMIVPKGSKYFIGIDGDIVANNLIWR